MNTQELVKLFGRCNFSVYETVTEQDIENSMQLIKNEPDGMDEIENLFLIYISNAFHSPNKCCCEDKKVGIIFKNCIKDHKFKSGWTGLHCAVNVAENVQGSFKKQCITAFIKDFPELLFEPYCGDEKRTPLMIAAWKSDKIVRYLLAEFLNENNLHKFSVINEHFESVLTYSFRYKRQENANEDVSIVLLEKLFKSVEFSVLIKAAKEFTCPVDVIKLIASKYLDLKDSVQPKQFIEFLEYIMKRNNLEAIKFNEIVNAIKRHDKNLFETNSLYFNNFNILDELAKFVDISTNRQLLSTFYTNFLNNGSIVNTKNQCNIVHFACKRDNIFLLESLKCDHYDHFISLMKQVDSENKHPAFYGRSHLKILKILKNESTSLLENLCLDNGDNIISLVFNRSYKDDFETLKWSKFSLLQSCNNDGDSAMHLMLSSHYLCDPVLVQEMIDRFKEEIDDIDIVNNKGLTPLLTLCCNIDRFEDEDDPIKIIEMLVNAGADVNVAVSGEVITKFGGSTTNVTAEWLARMSVFHSADDPSDFDFDAILAKIQRAPRYQDDTFLPDRELFEKLRSVAKVDNSNMNTKLINLIGDYPSVIGCDSSNIIFCRYPNFRNLFYSCLNIQPNRATTFMTPDHVNLVLENSLFVVTAHLEYNLQKVQLSQTISKKQKGLLACLKTKMELNYLQLPADWFDPTLVTTQELPLLNISESLAVEAGCTLETLKLDLCMLSDLGLVTITDDLSHIVNIPYILSMEIPETGTGVLSSLETPESKALRSLGIPPKTFTETRSSTASTLQLFELSVIGHNENLCNGEYLFNPLVDMLAYLLAADNYNFSNVDRSESPNNLQLIVFGINTIEIKLVDAKITISSSDKSIRQRVGYAIEVAIKHLRNGNIGQSESVPTTMSIKVEQSEGKTDLDTPYDKLIPSSSKVSATTKLRDVPVANLKELFSRMSLSPNVIKLSERNSLKSTVAEVGSMRWFSSLVRKHGKATVQDFYHIYKQDGDYEVFLALLLDVLGLDEEHMKRWKDNLRDFDWCWLIWTGVIGFAIAILTVVTSVLFETDGGFGGFAGIPAVFIASAIVKKTCCRNKEGKFEDVVEQDMQKCGNCFA